MVHPHIKNKGAMETQNKQMDCSDINQAVGLPDTKQSNGLLDISQSNGPSGHKTTTILTEKQIKNQNRE